MANVYDWPLPVPAPLRRTSLYRSAGCGLKKRLDWKRYLVRACSVNLIGFAAVYAAAAAAAPASPSIHKSFGAVFAGLVVQHHR